MAGVAHARSHPGSGPFTLLAADGHPVLAEPAAGELVVLDTHNGEPERRLPIDGQEPHPLISGSAMSPYVAIVGPHTGTLQIVDLTDQRQAAIGIGSDSPDAARFLGPLMKGDLVFVPDFLQGAVIVVRVRHDQLSLVGQVHLGFPVTSYCLPTPMTSGSTIPRVTLPA